MSAASITAADDRYAVRRAVYGLLIAVAIGQMAGRILAVNSVDRIGQERQRIAQEKQLKQDNPNSRSILRPFLSANDRSRWCTIRALVEYGTYAIDEVTAQPTWDTIDMVRHVGPDGKPHLYSSKPPLLATLLAGEYWLIERVTGATLEQHPFEIGRFMLLSLHVPCVLAYLLVLARFVERYGTSDWARLFVMAAGAFGTFLTTFEIVLNNHLLAAVSVEIALYCGLRVWLDGERHWRFFALAGLFGAFAVTNDLPALAFFALLAAALVWKAPREALLAFAPPAAIVAAGFFGTNYAAHGQFTPPYAYRNDSGKPVLELKRDAAPWLAGLPDALNDKRVPDELREALRTHEQPLSNELEVRTREAGTSWWLVDGGRERVYSVQATSNGFAIQLWDSWYHYAFHRNGQLVLSYWFAPTGIVDRGEASIGVYALHVLIGHHGIFSLTPIWLLSILGLFKMLRDRAGQMRWVGASIAAISAVCLTFYILRPMEDRNYGGSTSGFRWAFWLAPLWLAALLPATESAAASRWKRVACLVLLAWSVMSVAYPTWNPWTHPWLMNWFQYLGWIKS